MTGDWVDWDVAGWVNEKEERGGEWKRWQTWSSPICSVDNRIHKAESSHWHAHLGNDQDHLHLCVVKGPHFVLKLDSKLLVLTCAHRVGWNIQLPSSRCQGERDEKIASIIRYYKV